MALKQMRAGSFPSDIESNPLSLTRLAGLGLPRLVERWLGDAGFETAGDIASRSAEELKAFCYFTPAMILEIERALGRLGLALRQG